VPIPGIRNRAEEKRTEAEQLPLEYDKQ